jgi:hypothetical protein
MHNPMETRPLVVRVRGAGSCCGTDKHRDHVPLNYWGAAVGWEGEHLSRKYDRFGESRRRGGAWWRDGFYLWILILAAAGLILITPPGRSLLTLVGIHLAAVAIHEGGHYLAALRLRYRVTSVRNGPLEITPGYRGWRMRLVKVALDGHVEALPPDHRYAPGRDAMFAAAGPLANFAAMLALHGLYLLIAMLPAEGVTMSVRNFGVVARKDWRCGRGESACSTSSRFGRAGILRMARNFSKLCRGRGGSGGGSEVWL